MEFRKLLVVPMLAGTLVLGGCGEEEPGVGEEVEEGVGVVEEGVGEGVEVVEPVGEGAVVGTAEVLGNGVDDDGDGLVDEET